MDIEPKGPLGRAAAFAKGIPPQASLVNGVIGLVVGALIYAVITGPDTDLYWLDGCCLLLLGVLLGIVGGGLGIATGRKLRLNYVWISGAVGAFIGGVLTFPIMLLLALLLWVIVLELSHRF